MFRKTGIKHPKFSTPKFQLAKKNIIWEIIERICFRGDDRDPDEIFEKGLLPRHHGMIDDDTILIDYPFESAKKKVVSASSRFCAAAAFPLDAKKKATWVYIFKLHKGFDVHKHGYTALAKKGLNENNSMGLFVDEIMTSGIPKQDIIGAVRIVRDGYDELDEIPDYLSSPVDAGSPEEALINFYKKVGKYKIETFRLNSACTLSPEEKQLAYNFIEKETLLNHQKFLSASRLPFPSSGFFYQPQKSLLKKLLDSLPTISLPMFKR